MFECGYNSAVLSENFYKTIEQFCIQFAPLISTVHHKIFELNIVLLAKTIKNLVTTLKSCAVFLHVTHLLIA